MRKKRLIPFDWLPASWGLAGPAYDEAKAYYEYDGYDLAVRLAEFAQKAKMSLMLPFWNSNSSMG